MTTQPSAPETTRQAILRAARTVVQRDGAAALTLETVARVAGVSKGGLLYHFPNKDALIVGMLEAMVTAFEAAMAAYVRAEGEPPPPGAWTRAYLQANLAISASDIQHHASLLAAVAVRPELLAPIRARFAVWQQRMEVDGLDPALATVIRLAVDGWFMADLFGLVAPEEPLRTQVIQLLLALSAVRPA